MRYVAAMLKSPVVALALACVSLPDAAAQVDAKQARAPVVVTPAHDPPDMPFRRAPMGLASRSIVVPLATNVHLAWDAKLLRTHTVWEGESLNLYGPPFNGTATRFICQPGGLDSWGGEQRLPWNVQRKLPLTSTVLLQEVDLKPPQARFLGVLLANGTPTFAYEIGEGTQSHVRVRETPRLEKIAARSVVVRRFEISPCDKALSLVVHSERGSSLELAAKQATFAIARPNDVLLASVTGAPRTQVVAVNIGNEFIQKLDVERDGKGPYSATLTNTVPGPFVRLYVFIKADRSSVSFDVTTTSCRDSVDAKMVANELARLHSNDSRAVPSDTSRPSAIVSHTLTVLADSAPSRPESGDDFFRVEHFPVPKDIKLMVGGMDFLPNGDLAVCTLAGEVWIVEGATNAPQRAVWRRFARGLNEPAGLKVVNGRIVVVQKCELTRLTDTDGNGEADLFECLNDDWGYNGNYHSFAFGPALDAAGNFYVMLTGHRTIYDLPRMGWALRLAPEGQGAKSKVENSKLAAAKPADLLTWPFERFKAEPFCSGLRCPNGFGTHQGDIFITDNQGHWVAANKLVHLQAGKFYGHPSATPAPREQFDGDMNATPPAVWFPYAWVRSASGIATIGDARFGPFRGQLLVGEFQNASVVRVALEKVGGEWQGAVFPFAKGFASGVNRLAFGPDGKLYVGGLRMGHWTSIAPQPHSLDRVSFTGKVPFEIRDVRARSDGFELTFTQPVNAASAGDVENWDALQYTYGYEGRHNAPEKDRDEKLPGSEVRVTNAAVSADKLRVSLTIEGCKPRHVVMVRATGVKNSEGRPLRNDTFHYTLNAIPRR